MPCQFSFFPGAEVGCHFFAQRLNAVAQLLDLAAGYFRPAPAASCRRAICCSIFSSSWCVLSPESSLAAIAVPGGPARFHHGEEELDPGHHQRVIGHGWCVLRLRLRIPVSGNFHLPQFSFRKISDWPAALKLLVDYAHCAPPAQFLDAGDEIAVWLRHYSLPPPSPP